MTSSDEEFRAELREDFLLETGELLPQFEELLLDFESDLQNMESIAGLFRIAHTIKGLAQSIGYENLGGFIHIMENLLDDCRSEKLAPTPEMVDCLLKGSDLTKAMIEAIRENDDDSSIDTSQVHKELEAIVNGESGSVAVKTEDLPPAQPDDLQAQRTLPAEDLSNGGQSIAVDQGSDLAEDSLENVLYIGEIPSEAHVTSLGVLQVADCKDAKAILSSQPTGAIVINLSTQGSDELLQDISQNYPSISVIPYMTSSSEILHRLIAESLKLSKLQKAAKSILDSNFQLMQSMGDLLPIDAQTEEIETLMDQISQACRQLIS